MQVVCSVPTYSSYDLRVQTGRPSNRPRPPFGTRLHQLREQAGLSQREIAERLGISARAYAFWEREPVALKADQLATLADILGVSADFLVGRKEPKQRGTGPAGKMRQLFEAASRLSRSQQQKVAAVLEPFVAQHSNGR
jgi:transcriptional regulator with XRE-family HTH domain